MDERILIWGSGAIGGTIGAYLARAGTDVLMVDTVAKHVEVMNRDGLLIEGPVDTFTTPIYATTPGKLSGRFERVLLCVKGQNTATAVKMIKPHLANDGYVVSLQNGLNETLIAKMIGENRTIGAFINFGADYQGPGHIQFGARSTVVVGELDGKITPRLQALLKKLNIFEPNAIASDNVWGFLWSKLAYCSLLWANAVIDGHLHEVFGSEIYRKMLTELTREVVQIAEANGTKLEPFDPFDPLAFTQNAGQAAAEHAFANMYNHRLKSAKKHSGMWRDIAVRKRKTELETLLLPVLQAGVRHSVKMPLNTLLAKMVQEIETGKRRQTWQNFNELKDRMASTDA